MGARTAGGRFVRGRDVNDASRRTDEINPSPSPWLRGYSAAEWIGGLVVGVIFFFLLLLARGNLFVLSLGVLAAWFAIRVCWLLVRVILGVLGL